jgi:ankyrin repeat protein
MLTSVRRLLLSTVVFLLASCTQPADTALSRAAAHGDLTEVNRLIAAGASISDREAALVSAARNGQAQSISVLVASGADPDTRAGVNGWPVLMHAIHKDQPQAVSALLSSGANVNATGPNGETALMMAAGYGYTDIVRILLHHEADVYAKMPNGDTALDFALSGVMDIDRFTWGHCQDETVRILRRTFPDLMPKDRTKLKSCS